MKYTCEFCGKTFNNEFNALAHEKQCAGASADMMSAERKAAINNELSALWYECKMNPYETFRADAALQLAECIKTLWLMGFGTTGADVDGHITSCPHIVDSPAQAEYIPLLLQKSI